MSPLALDSAPAWSRRMCQLPLGLSFPPLLPPSLVLLYAKLLARSEDAEE